MLNYMVIARANGRRSKLQYIPLPIAYRLHKLNEQWNENFPWWVSWGARRIAEGRVSLENSICLYCEYPIDQIKSKIKRASTPII